MFSHYIYFIVVLIIYNTYHPSQKQWLTAMESGTLFLGIALVFAGFTWIVFHRLKAGISDARLAGVDRRFNTTLFRMSILAIFVFFVDIYVLHLPAFLAEYSIFKIFPTLLAFLFLGCFVFYLTLVWICAYPVHRIIYAGGVSRKSYVISNISFSLPVLIPWLIISSVVDIIDVLPLEPLHRFLSSLPGQISTLIILVWIAVVAGPVLIQKLWRCRPLQAGCDRSRIENVCRKAHLKYADILIWPLLGEVTITAAVMGLIGRFRYLLVSPALLRFLVPEEIDAVIAHEIGHIKKKHLFFYVLFFLGYMALFYAVFDLIICFIIYSQPVFQFIDLTGIDEETVTSVLLGIILITLLIIYIRYIFGYVMRNFERQADIYVYAIFDSAAPLISAFRKIAAVSGQRADKPNWHHFSIKQRIEYLKRCEADRSWIRHHNRKIRNIIAVYMAVLLLTGWVGYRLNNSVPGRTMMQHCSSRMILRQLEKLPDKQNRFTVMGDLYYAINNYEKAIQAYEQAIEQSPNDIQALNNLAWLFATCENQKFRNASKALILARKAAEIDSAPHILDTLAESFFVNGLHQKAVTAASQALEKAEKNQSYYKKQLKKFSDALNRSSSQIRNPNIFQWRGLLLSRSLY